MDITALDSKRKLVLGASGLAFFFLLGLGGSLYFAPPPGLRDKPAPPRVPAKIAAAGPAESPRAGSSMPGPTIIRLPPADAPLHDTSPPIVASTPPSTERPSADHPRLEPAGAADDALALTTPPPRLALMTPPSLAPVASPATEAARPPLPEPPHAAATRLAKPKSTTSSPAAAHHPPNRKPHAPPVAAHAAKGPFRVQFGAFAHEANAQRLSRAIATRAMAAAVTQGQDATGRSFYFVRSPAFDDLAAARAAVLAAQQAARHAGFADASFMIFRAQADGTPLPTASR